MSSASKIPTTFPQLWFPTKSQQKYCHHRHQFLQHWPFQKAKAKAKYIVQLSKALQENHHSFQEKCDEDQVVPVTIMVGTYLERDNIAIPL